MRKESCSLEFSGDEDPFHPWHLYGQIFKLSKESERRSHWEESQLDKGHGKRKKEHGRRITESKSEDCLQLILKKSSHFL